jgi:hypothetical protein
LKKKNPAVLVSEAFKFGGGCANVHEPVDLTVSCVYRVSWELQSLDLTELARLRWIERWRIERIAEHFGYSMSGIKGALRKIEADPSRASIELGHRKKRPWALASRSFRGK